MKNLRFAIIIVLCVLFVAPLINGCKKGENDPLLSFKSRDGRIIGVWKLIRTDGTHKSTINGNVSTTTNTFDGTVYSETSSVSGNTTSATGAYEMTLSKNGQFSFTEKYTPNGSALVEISEADDWHWVNSDKNKLSIQFNKGGDYLFEEGIYYIDQLKSKIMVLTNKWDKTDNGDVSTYSYTYTFKKQ